MSRARLHLHLAALLAPLAVAAAWCLLMSVSSGGFSARQFLVFGGIGVLSAQTAALLCWRALDRRARAGDGAWIVGLVMATITHLLFGIFGDALLIFAAGGWARAIGEGGVTSFITQIAFFTLMSVFALGALTFPVTALLANWIGAVRRRELAVDV